MAVELEVLAIGSMKGGIEGLLEFGTVVEQLRAEGVREAIVHDEACTHWWKLRIDCYLTLYIGTMNSFEDWKTNRIARGSRVA